jgi:hypothetical protein
MSNKIKLFLHRSFEIKLSFKLLLFWCNKENYLPNDLIYIIYNYSLDYYNLNRFIINKFNKFIIFKYNNNNNNNINLFIKINELHEYILNECNLQENYNFIYFYKNQILTTLTYYYKLEIFNYDNYFKIYLYYITNKYEYHTKIFSYEINLILKNKPCEKNHKFIIKNDNNLMYQNCNCKIRQLDFKTNYILNS